MLKLSLINKILENPWECICKWEWIGKWLTKIGTASTPSGSLRCLITPCEDKNEDIPETTTKYSEPENHRFLITLIAGFLAVVAFIFLVAAAIAYMQANCYTMGPLAFKNLPSDMVRLIPSQESLLSFPNPIANDVIIKPYSNYTPIPAISINIKENATKTDEEKQANLDKKRVRFDGV